MNQPLKKRLFGALAAAAAILALGAVIYLARVPCVFSEITGLYCAGCGTGRMLHSLMEWDMHAAFAYNPFMIVALPCMAVFMIVQMARYIKTGALFTSVPAKCFLALVVLLGLLFSVMRNLSAFSYLAPV